MSDQQGQEPPVETASAPKSTGTWEPTVGALAPVMPSTAPRAANAPLDSTLALAVDAEPSEAGHALDAQPGLTQALRAGLGENRVSVGTAGLSLSLPLGVNPFDYFKDVEPEGGAGEEMSSGPVARRHDIPEMQAALTGSDEGEAVPAAGPLALYEMRVARMVQMMATFGYSGSEAELRHRDREGPRFDYFA